MKIVKKETSCEVCGEIFEGEFIQHEKPEDDFPFEQEPAYQESYDEDGTTIGEWIDPEPSIYPHIHEQPTVECHICPKCRNNIKKPL